MQNFIQLYKKSVKQKGMSVLEVLIGSTIITVGILALSQTYSTYVRYALTHDKKIQSTYLLEEGIEAMTLMRDSSWSTNISSVSSATTSLYFNGTMWQFSSTTNEYIDGTFVRNVVVSPVTRDGNNRIASSGSVDSNTRKVTVTVSYLQGSATTSDTLSKYIVNMYSN
jgi:Tfp pilus assembly protein PilV